MAPLFDYQCCDCGHYEQDKMVKKWDDKIVCPFCDNEMKKEPSAVNFDIEPAVK